MTIEEKILRYLELVALVNKIFDSTSNWETKHDLIFGCSKEIEELAIGRLDYYHPDSSYEADTNAYVFALNFQAGEIKRAMANILAQIP